MLVETSEGFRFTVPDEVAMQCVTLRPAMEDPGVVPLANVTAAHMACIVRFHMEAAQLKLADTPPAEVEAWKTQFFASMPRMDVFMVMEATNFLGDDGMLEDACVYVRGLIKGRTPDEIREIFMMPVDTTADEGRKMAEELVWALV